jgi:mxaJ protein
MDSPILRRVKIGFERDTPPESGLKIRGLVQRAIAFDVGYQSGQSPVLILDAAENGQVDVIITWEPAIGAFLQRYPDLTVVSVPNSRAMGSPEQYAFPMSMGVRENDHALKERLDEVIANHQTELESILSHYGVKLYTPRRGPYSL